MGQAVGRTTFIALFAVGEFRALWAAELFSIAGDQLARVALAVLVYARTGSAALTGLTYALTFVPAFVGGALFGGVADRHSRRGIMIAADVVRAGLVALMAVPGMPLGLMCVLVGATTLLGGPFKAAQQALLPDVLSARDYPVGQSIRMITIQSAQLLGFAGGGALVAVLSPTTGLLLDAGTFVVSAVILRLGVQARPVPRPLGSPGRLTSSMTAAARLVRDDPRLRVLMALCWLSGVYVAPEALAAPYATDLGGGADTVGLLMASDPAGSVLGAFVFVKWVPEPLRLRVVGVLGIAAGLPLVLCIARPGLAVSMVLFALLGMLVTACLVQSTTTATLLFPGSHRAQGSGFLSAGLYTAQGIGALAAGALADWIGPATTIALVGAAGAIVAAPLAVHWHRVQTSLV